MNFDASVLAVGSAICDRHNPPVLRTESGNAYVITNWFCEGTAFVVHQLPFLDLSLSARDKYLYPPVMENSIPQSSSMAVNNEASSSSVNTISRKKNQAQRQPRASSVPLVPDNYAVGYVYSSEMMIHFSPHGHPEQPARVQEIWRTLVQDQLTKSMKWIPIRNVRKDEALLVHSEDHWDKVLSIQCKYRNIIYFPIHREAKEGHSKY